MLWHIAYLFYAPVFPYWFLPSLGMFFLGNACFSFSSWSLRNLVVIVDKFVVGKFVVSNFVVVIVLLVFGTLV